MFSIYVHIPFCLKKCWYCDFYSVPVSAGGVPHEKYLAAIIRQLDLDVVAFQMSGKKVSTVYFGGGTPSLMPPEFFGRVLSALSRHFTVEHSAEISLEVNPATASGKWFKDIRREGVTRVSIGVQSFCDCLLKTLGRIHSSEDAMTAVASAQSAGFRSVNLDLMYAISGGEISDLEDDLRTAMTFQPEHVSVYQLTNPSCVDSKTSEDEQLKQMRVAARMLNRGRWKRYEISNFAKQGFECAHNLNYWRYGEYLGLGAGAASFLYAQQVFAKRWTQAKDVEKYIYGNTNTVDAEEIDVKTAMGEFCFMGLRTTAGISAAEFEKTFEEKIESIYGGEIDELVKAGLVCYEKEKERLALTQKGLELSNQVFERFV